MTPMNIAMTNLLNGICFGAILAAIMMLILKFFSRLNSTTRFTVLWMTLIAVIALLAAPLAPRASVADLQIDSLSVSSPGPTVISPPASAQVYRPGGTTRATLAHSVLSQRNASTFEQRPEPTRSQNASTNPLLAAPLFERSLIRIRSAKFLRAVAIVWVAFSFMLLARLAAAYRVLRSLKSTATPASPDWQLRFSRLCATHDIRRQPHFLVSSHVSGPMSLGFFRPVIVIPPALLETLLHSELEQIILHELAHLHRRDDWSNLAQKLIEAMLPIQPAVRWLGYQMSLAREMACDDWVIAATGTPRPYAAALTKVAELSQWQRAGILAAGAVESRSQLFRRVRQMLDRTRNTAPRLTILPLATALALVVTLTCLSVQAPQLIAFAQSDASADSLATPAPAVPPTAQSPQSSEAMPAASLAPRARTVQAAQLPATGTLAPTALLAAQAEPSSAPEAGLSPMSPRSPLSPPSPQSPTSPLSPLSPLAPMAQVGSQQNGDSHVQMTTRNGWQSLSITVDGAVEFTDDDADIKSLSPNGRFQMEDGELLSKRSYEVRADAAGNLTRLYSVGWSTKPMDDEGRAWLAHTLPQVIRESGIGAGPRVARILRHGGPQAVLSEIERIHSDGSKRVYLEQLFSQATLKLAELKEAARLIRSVSSDGDKARVIIAVDADYFTVELRSYLFDVTESINSDGDKRRVLSDIVKKDGGSVETLASAARAARHISSDGDKAEVLIEMAGPYRPSGGVDMAYFEAANSISSDGDHAHVLSKMLALHGDDQNTFTRTLLSAKRISSDGDKARVLKEAVTAYSEDAPVRQAFFDAANSISSDGDHQGVLVTLAQKQGIGTDTVSNIAKSAQRISSDGDKARVLIELVGTNVEPASDAFFAAANSITSDGDRSRVLAVVLDKPGTSSSVAVAAIQSATGISSDGDKARVLLEAADRYSRDPAVKAAVRKAAESLHSDGDYRTVMSRIARHETTL
jgi:beta-lactamase regulating signal transducer with metallopeptidase domain